MINNPIKIALIALALSGSALTAVQPAKADHVVVAFDPGVVAFGYHDGYWDRQHAWHRWHDRREASAFREANREHYYEYRHTRDHGGGWREHERYWETH